MALLVDLSRLRSASAWQLKLVEDCLTKAKKYDMLSGGCSEQSSQDGLARNESGGRDPVQDDLYEEYCDEVAKD